ncbi:hypothetical protein [Clostridium lundense]|uniref:hypothetical protein n=1 Tax=Clostridium lundense TaxID=319475 RepID=UPI000A8FE187|nr:hypothetical protein [Clostridium lundense]
MGIVLFTPALIILVLAIFKVNVKVSMLLSILVASVNLIYFWFSKDNVKKSNIKYMKI